MDKISMNEIGPDGGTLTVLGMYEAYHQSDQTHYRTYVSHVEPSVIAVGSFTLLMALASECSQPLAFLRHLNNHTARGRSAVLRARREFLSAFTDLPDEGESLEITLSIADPNSRALIPAAISCVDDAISCIAHASLVREGRAASRPALADRRREICAQVRHNIANGTIQL